MLTMTLTKVVIDFHHNSIIADSKISLRKEGHYSNLIWGKILSKIVEDREKCSTTVLKLIEVFLHKNSPVVMENLVYRFLKTRVCKDHDLDRVKRMIRGSNPRQRLIDDVREIHFLVSESLKEYSNYSTIAVHESMSLYPINQDDIINSFDFFNQKIGVRNRS